MRTSYFPNSCPVLDPGEYSGFQVTGWSNGGKNQNKKKPCILTGFIKQMQCNELNIKTAAKQVWLFFIRKTTRPGRGTNTNPQTVLDTQQILDRFSYPKNPKIEKFTPPPPKKKKTLRSSPSPEIRSTASGVLDNILTQNQTLFSRYLIKPIKNPIVFDYF